MENIISVHNEDRRRVAIYIRVSTAEQKIEGYSLEAQRKRLVDYVEQNKVLNLYTKKEWIYVDVHSGSDLGRPQLQEMLRDVKAGKFDAVLVWKIDRLSRSLKHLLTIFEDFEKNGVSFISVQENIDFKGPIGRLIFQIFGAIAQFERELIKGRTLMGKIASAELGNFTGTSIPYGYKPVENKNGKGKKLALIEQEKHWVNEMFSWYIYENLGDGQIAKRLNELKVPRGQFTKKKDLGSKWTDEMVTTILVNPLYRGEFVANKKDDSGHLLPEDQWTIVSVPACVSEFTFRQAQLARQGKHGGSRNTSYLLSGKLKDMTLDFPYAFTGAKRYKGGFSYRRKQFKKDGVHYPVFEIPGQALEDFVWSKIMEAMEDPEVFIQQYLSKQFKDKTRIQKIETELDSLRERAANIELEKARIEIAYEKGAYGEEQLMEKLAEKGLEENEVAEKIQQLEDELNVMSSVDVEVEKLKEASEQVKYRLNNLDALQKKILCDLFIDRVEMYRQRKGDRWQVSAEIYFRFNPQKFHDTQKQGSTENAHADTEKQHKNSKNKNSGRSGGT